MYVYILAREIYTYTYIETANLDCKYYEKQMEKRFKYFHAKTAVKI